MARIVRDDATGRALAADTLRSGGIVAIPTDTVYGVAVRMSTPGGIERLFHVKQRPVDKGIVLLLADASQASALGILTPAAEALATACWPGGLTLVLAQRPDIRLPEGLTGGAPTIGLRVADHEAPRSLARAVGPLPVTSANVSGRPEAGDAGEIDKLLGASIDLILDGGRAHGGRASTVVDCSGALASVLRAGAIPTSRLADILDAAGIAHDLSAPGGD